MSSITQVLEHIAARWGTDMFEDGDCHTLAMALHQASASEDAPAERKGSLLACLRKSVEEDGSVFETGYSHMVYVAPDGTVWDIRGADADARWEENFDTEALDKWGMRTELEWIAVPCNCPGYTDTHVWLQEHFGCIDTSLQHQLVRAIRGLSGDCA